MPLTPLTVYGIKQCSTMKKAFDWLEAHGHAYQFHDYKKLPPPPQRLAAWCASAGWEALVNTRGTTWRKLDTAERQIDSAEQAMALMQRYPSLIKRPVIEGGAQLLIGFDAERYAANLGDTASPGDPAP